MRLLSGVFEADDGHPISMLIPNENARPDDYQEVRRKSAAATPTTPTKPSTGCEDWRGGGRTSARETAARVAGGAIARKLLRERYGVQIVAWVTKVGRLEATSGSTWRPSPGRRSTRRRSAA